MIFRTAIPDFQLANPLYRGALVNFYLADAAGNPTTTLAELYGGATGNVRVSNPVTLDGDGKFFRPVYIASPVVATVVGSNVDSHTTGVIAPRGSFKGAWRLGASFTSGDVISNPAGDDLYVVRDDGPVGASFAGDVASGRLEFVLGVLIANTARNEAIAANTAAQAARERAEAAATTAEQIVGSADQQAINNRFLALETKPNAFLIAQGIAYQGLI